jgi:multidrug resistance efflux pump
VLRLPASQLELAVVHRQLVAASVLDDPGERMRSLLSTLVRLTNARSARYLAPDGQGGLKVAALLGTRSDDDGISRQRESAAGDAAESRRLVVMRPSDPEHLTLLASPVEQGDTLKGVILLELLIGTQPVETFATVLQLTAALAALSEWRMRSAGPAAESGTLDGLSRRLADAKSLDAACLETANLVAQAARARYAVVGLRDGRGRRIRLRAVSGATELDRRSNLVRTLESALTEIARSERTSHPEAARPEPGLRVREASGALQAGVAAQIPLVTSGGDSVGAILLLGADEPETGPRPGSTLAGVSRTVLSDALWAIQLGPGERKGAGRRRGRKAKLGLAAAGILAAVGVLALPLEHRIQARVQMEPAVRRFVVAPFDGVVESVLAEPGDTVAEGDPLARLDGRDLELERIKLSAQRDQMAKQRNVAMARGDAAARQIADLELARIDAELGLVDYRAGNLAVRSPITGVVLQGDLERAEGSPVTKGLRLFELAPLDDMIAEVEIPAEDVAFFREGASTEIRLTALPYLPITGKLSGLRPRAEIRDGRNLFIAEMVVPPQDAGLRPGMRGSARIDAGRRTVGWLLFHRPWERLRQWLG